MARKQIKWTSFVLSSVFLLASCKKKESSSAAKDPDTAPAAFIDRFSTSAAHLQVRTSTNGLPAANVPVNFDQPPFITTGFTATGQSVQYYNFDLQPTTPAPIYVLIASGENTPVKGQFNIVDVIPGSTGYNDFWQVYDVTVPASYVANTITSYSEIVSKGYPIAPTSSLVNCPVVPKGSTAVQRYPNSGDASLTTGWYKDSVVYYFNFAEKALSTTSNGMVPLAPIYVTFNINPNQPGGGPASGFKEVPDSVQTHNVISVVPTDAGYTPLWMVIVYDNADFSSVSNFTTASEANILVPDAGNVNCPVVNIVE